ncbi:hypothetical protein D3C86_1566310 [compost metagenome]
MQALEMNRSGLRELCSRLNDLLELGLVEADIDTTFEMWWTKYENMLTDPTLWEGDAKPRKTPTTSDLSVQLTQISTTLSGLVDRVDRIDGRTAHFSPQERWAMANYVRDHTRSFRTIDDATMRSLDDETLRSIAATRISLDLEKRGSKRQEKPTEDQE